MQASFSWSVDVHVTCGGGGGGGGIALINFYHFLLCELILLFSILSPLTIRI